MDQVTIEHHKVASECIIEEATGDIYMTEKNYKGANDHYLKALEVGNRHFDAVKKQADENEMQMKKDGGENK